MRSRILVTGGAGFIGSTLVRALIATDRDVAVIDAGTAAGLGALDGLALDLVEGDIRDDAALERAVAGANAIVHLAARTSVPASIADPVADFAVNVDGSLRLLEAARRHGVVRIVFASSNAVIAGHGSPLHEDLVPRPVAPYGAAKAAVEAYLNAYGRAYGLETVALRFANAYGPRSAHKTSVVPMFVRAALAGQPLIVRGTGAQTRDFVHVDDIVAAILACLEVPLPGAEGTILQIGTGVETSIGDLAQTVIAATGGRGGIVHEPASAGDVARNFSDVSRALDLLGWRPQVSLVQGIGSTVDWYREHGG